MAKWWMLGVLLVLGLMPARGEAQLFRWFQKKQPDPTAPFSAFSNPPEPEPDFCPDPRTTPKNTTQFCPEMSSTPFVPIDEEKRNAFADYKIPEPDPLNFWLKGEYLNWQFKPGNFGAILATTSSAPDLQTNFGALGQANTVVLFNQGDHDIGRIMGSRITGGISTGFLPPLEITGFFLNRHTTLFNAASDGGSNTPILLRPVLETQGNVTGPTQFNLGLEGGFLAGAPNVAAGDLNIATSANLWGIEPNFILPLGASDFLFVDLLGGYRFLELREGLQISNTLTPANGNFVVPFGGDPLGFGQGFSTVAVDQFGTRNRFNGGQFGIRSGLTLGRFGLLADAKLALGETNQVLDVNGSSTLYPPAGRPITTFPGGVLATPSNMGHFSSNTFSVVPEIGINVGFQIHRSIRIFAGYTVIFWTQVVRPGDQLNNILDTRQLPTDFQFQPGFHSGTPGPTLVHTDFWAQGFNFGLLIGF